MARTNAARTRWPTLPSDDWTDTLETVHLFTQVIGKVRMVCSPWINHSWSVTLYVSPRGLRTSLVPYGTEGFEWAFDFVDHHLELTTTAGARHRIDLAPMSVARFYADVLDAMSGADMPVEIDPMPNEIPDAIPFPDDEQHAGYDADQVHALWRALVQADRVLSRFRAGYRGKASPVHFFWGSFDLAVTRFSGRPAPPHPGGMPNFPDDVAREAYAAEVTSAGLWLGNRQSPTPLFYSYAYPTPDGFSNATVKPAEASWLEEMGEFALPYDAVARADDPDALLEQFLESAHAAAADLAGWDREALECQAPYGPDWWHERPG